MFYYLIKMALPPLHTTTILWSMNYKNKVYTLCKQKQIMSYQNKAGHMSVHRSHHIMLRLYPSQT
jgi:hypothetical protein